MSSGASAKRERNSATIAGSAFGCSSRRTTGSKRRCCSSRSTMARLLRPSSSSTSTSASRQTRNWLALSISIPGKSFWAFATITSSRPTNTRPPDSTPVRTRSHWYSSRGTLTRTSTDSPLTGSPRRKAHDVERFETYGNGCASSRLSGVSTGEIRVEDLRDLGPLLLGQLAPADQVHVVLGQARPQHVGVAVRLLARASP